MQINQTTAIVRVYMPVRKSNYWPKHVIPQYDGWPCTNLLAVISEERRHHCSSISGSRPREKKKLESVHNAKAESNLMECIHAGVM